MAEEQVMSQTLVLDNNREKLAKRIEDVGLDLRNELLERQKTAFCEVFTDLCKQYFKLRKFDLLKITDNEEFLTLESEVFQRAERGYKLTKYVGMPLLALIPIFGWGVIASICGGNFYRVDGFSTFHYYKLRKILMEREGTDFFPFETFKQLLQSKS